MQHGLVHCRKCRRLVFNTDREKPQHGIERLIDTVAGALIDKNQFTTWMNRPKARLVEAVN